MIRDHRTIYALPSCNPVAAHKHLPNWLAQGYRVIIGQDSVRYKAPEGVEVVYIGGTYPGYANACSLLIANAIPKDAQVVVFGGDDMDPDPNCDAAEIERQYLEHFPNLDGIMQPTGDPMGKNADGVPAAARICGSPWVGRVWLDHANNGAGPFHPGYHHFYSDEELHDVASVTGKLWQRPDLSHMHDHYTREPGRPEPAHHPALADHWAADRALYQARRAARYPGAIPAALADQADWRRLPKSMSAA